VLKLNFDITGFIIEVIQNHLPFSEAVLSVTFFFAVNTTFSNGNEIITNIYKCLAQ
jgi:hypothetical protein